SGRVAGGPLGKIGCAGGTVAVGRAVGSSTHSILAESFVRGPRNENLRPVTSSVEADCIATGVVAISGLIERVRLLFVLVFAFGSCHSAVSSIGVATPNR